ncbi:MAG TPA: hypothetical protein VFS25_04780 [Chitinophaga sp.]|uniref:hypothetical protein n=1 Tax=Chitinophaga sp. TaxID=1869181 RepID=UPI002DBB0639|nr:hypothetical protein [Chitinophaga sp.]HEU4552122.1 hypothetical protein [Chitinophaga sp.]
MSTLSIPAHGKRPLKRSLLWTVLVFLLTGFHHYYGGIVYHTPWRQHVVLGGGMALLISVALFYLYRYRQQKIFLTLYLLLVFIMFGLGIAVFEGGYNHLVKIILYFGGLHLHTWRMLFPAPAYEVPGNFIFELTGVLQFFAGAMLFYFLKQVYNLYFKGKV